jgi:hypothetical protein
VTSSFPAKTEPCAGSRSGQTHSSNPRLKTLAGQANDICKVSGSSFERQRAIAVPMGPGPAVRASGAAGFGARPQSLVNDGLDGARAPAAFGAATEATIDLLGIAGKVLR